MTLHGILVLLGDDAPAAAREHLAARLAVTHGAHLSGLAPTGRPHLEDTASAAHAIDVADALRVGAWTHAEQLTRRFLAAARAEGVASVDAQAVEGAVLPLLLHHAACHDVVVVSPPPPSDPGWRAGVHFVEQLLTHSARPTLVVPGSGRFEHVGQRVVVAWDDSPAAVRATTDALPVLRRATQVWLCAWRRSGDAVAEAVRDRLEEVARWLLRHGVQSELRVASTPRPVGDAMLNDATILGADLIVMGTYGHARWLERVTGGATRTALRRATLPLWMSH